MFKFILFFVVIVVSVIISQSFDIKCVYTNFYNDKPDKSYCKIEQVPKVQPDEKLNLTEIKNPEEIQFFYLLNSTAITSFPKEIFDKLPSLELIWIDNSSIESLPKNSFDKPKEHLKVLLISKAKLKTVPKDLLPPLPKLESLKLIGNEIAEIEEGALTSSSLKQINLAKNNLTIIRNNTFAGVLNLQFIDLSENRIETIEDGAFDLLELWKLYLDKNRLKTLPTNLFDKMRVLKVLSLRSNNLTDISAVKKVPRLIELDLSDNPTLKGKDILLSVPLEQMERLYLENTGFNITAVPDLSTDIRLTELYISRNSLSDTELLNRLSRFNKLQRIELEGNNLQRLVGFNNVKNIFPELWFFNIKGNPLNCEWQELAQMTCESAHINCHGIYEDPKNSTIKKIC